MPRRYQTLIISTLAIGSALTLSACQQSHHEAKKPAAPAAPKVVAPVHTYHKQIRHIKPAALKAPQGAYILVMDASHAKLKSTGHQNVTLSIPLTAFTQVGQLNVGYESAPHYYNGHQAQTVWLNTPVNTFTGTHAILSSAFVKPHSVKILSESVEKDMLVFKLHSYKPFHYTHHLRQVVFNVSSSK